MEYLLLGYVPMFIASLIFVLLGYKFLYPSKPLFLTLIYFGFITFFMGRFYEVSRLILKLDIYNRFELGSLGIIGAFSFYLTSNFAIKHTVNIKTSKKNIVKSILIASINFLIYLIILNGNVTNIEKVIDLLTTIFISANIYYCAKHLMLMKEDNTNLLINLKDYNVLGIMFSFLIMLLLISFAYSQIYMINIVGITISITIIGMFVALKKGMKKWKE